MKNFTSELSLMSQSRSEQLATFAAMRCTSTRIKRLNIFQYILKVIVYSIFSYLVYLLLADRGGIIAFVLVITASLMAIDELLWRFLLLPAVIREQRIQSHKSTPNEPIQATRRSD
jgi:hypothetical protein